MKPLGDMKRHFWLAQRMAKVTGTDLVGAQQAGDLPQADWADMVETCRECDWTDGCVRWLQQNQTAEQVPTSCPNCGRMMDIRNAANEEM
ncbi:DUF6455 family protein [Thalassovita sp.]|uniref:DUF6455 family protein n=1 Tax=Thalassovita sp. TaxID=1979401 RepID=UPI0029DE7D88|nr:DUF6455 family protein [Thalassovita sp.]